MFILKDSTLLTTVTGFTVMTRLYESGNYSCVADNEAGTDTKYFLVTIVGKIYFTVGATMRFFGF